MPMDDMTVVVYWRGRGEVGVEGSRRRARYLMTAYATEVARGIKRGGYENEDVVVDVVESLC